MARLNYEKEKNLSCTVLSFLQELELTTTGTSASLVSLTVLPLSIASTTATSLACFCTWRARAYRCLALACAGSADHAGSARLAAPTARSTSSRVPCSVVARASSLAGQTEAVVERSPSG